MSVRRSKTHRHALAFPEFSEMARLGVFTAFEVSKLDSSEPSDDFLILGSLG